MFRSATVKLTLYYLAIVMVISLAFSIILYRDASNELAGRLLDQSRQWQYAHNMKIKEKYWQDMFKNAYPQKSFIDPDFCVLRFTPKSGRYYSMYKPRDFKV